MKHKYFNEVYPYAYYLVRKRDKLKYVGVRYANVRLGLTPNETFDRNMGTMTEEEFEKYCEGKSEREL